MNARILLAILAIALVAGGCARPLPQPQPGSALRAASVVGAWAQSPAIAGRVWWAQPEAPEARGLLASMAEIASAATVSLIELDTGNTAASTVTAANGTFSLDLAGWAPQPDKPYALEAIKGLGLGGQANRAGAPLARLRTIVQISGGAWTSLTGQTIVISRSTTALSAIAGLAGLDTPKIQALIGKVQPGSPDTFTPTADVSAADYQAVWGLVDAALYFNQDPIRAIARDDRTGGFLRLDRAPVVTDLSTSSGKPGDAITVFGSGFDPDGANNIVQFGGAPASQVEVDPAGTRLIVTVPTGAVAGPVTVAVGDISTEAPTSFVPIAVGRRISTVVGNGNYGFSADGTAAGQMQMGLTFAIAINPAGELLFGDGDRRVRKVDSAGIVRTIAGNGSAGYAGDRKDGGPATAAGLTSVRGLATDAVGNVYIAESMTNRVRKVNPSGIITTVAGTGYFGYSGDGGSATAAELDSPNGVATDGAGNLYIADTGNCRVRKVDSAGKISTVAGNGTPGYTGDGGPATAAALKYPIGLAFDQAGNLYIVAIACNCVRKMDTAGVITTVAGDGTSGYSGDGGPATAARLTYASRVTVDASGNIYVSEGFQGNRVRQIDTTGTISTLAGDGTAGFSGDGGPADQARLNEPSGMAADGAGNLYVADTGNFRIRKVSP